MVTWIVCCVLFWSLLAAMLVDVFDYRPEDAE